MKITILGGIYANSQRKIQRGKNALSLDFDWNPAQEALCYQRLQPDSEWWTFPDNPHALAFRSKDVQRIYLKQVRHYWRIWAKVKVPVGGGEYAKYDVCLDKVGYAYSVDASQEARKWARSFGDPGLYRIGWPRSNPPNDESENSKPDQGSSKETKPDDPSLDAVAHCTSTECPYFHLALSDAIRAEYDGHGYRKYIGPDYRCTAPIHGDDPAAVYLGKVCTEQYSKKRLKEIIDNMNREQREEEMRHVQIWK